LDLLSFAGIPILQQTTVHFACMFAILSYFLAYGDKKIRYWMLKPSLKMWPSQKKWPKKSLSKMKSKV